MTKNFARSRYLRLLYFIGAASLVCTSPATAQLGGFKCPLEGPSQVRPGDVVAASGGRFNSDRSGGKKHGALDLNSTFQSKVLASLSGKVAVAQKDWGDMGHTVIIDHGMGAYTVYGHLDSITIKEGVSVETGEQIGTVGYSGNAAALKAKGLPPHLHFALIQAGQTGLADKDMPLRQMKAWGDFWQSIGADLTGAVNPGLFLQNSTLKCWTGSTTMGAPGER